jgi:glutamate receptor, ionotropic, plant
MGIERKWFGGDLVCNSQANASESASVVTWSSLIGVLFITIGLWAIAGIINAALWFRPRQEEEQVREAVAELAIEHAHVNGDESIIWRIGRDSHLVIQLRGNPPPPGDGGAEGGASRPEAGNDNVEPPPDVRNLGGPEEQVQAVELPLLPADAAPGNVAQLRTAINQTEAAENTGRLLLPK